MRLGIVFGTRPEAIKLGPVVAELRALGLEPQCFCTGQHTTLLRGTPAETDLKEAVSLELPSTGKVGFWVGRAVPKLMDAFSEHAISHVAVQGDTMSALAGAWAALRLERPIAHIEAGLRSHSPTEPWPEERIRVGISRIADLHLAPTAVSMKNLLVEGISAEKIRITGNSGVSALARYGSSEKTWLAQPYVVVTMHRREWLDSSGVFDTFTAFIEGTKAHPEIDFLWPMHPNVRHRWLQGRFVAPSNCLVIDPVPYKRMTQLLCNAKGIVTDSGGLQEEAATLGVACAVMRNVSDRPESCALGIAKRFPATGEGMSEALTSIIDARIPARPSICYGTPDAARFIAQELVNWT